MDFDNTPSREGTYSYKWEKYKGKDILPTWIADTEFSCAPEILKALTKRVENGVLGYTLPSHYTPATDAVVNWCKQQYNWHVDPSWVVWTPGVVPAFNMACKAFCKTGDAILVQTPNYPPLLAAPALNGMQTLFVGSVIKNKRWTLDFDQLEKQLAKPECTLFLLCNPMNPAGSVLSQQELDLIAKLCNQHSVMLCSDEIHCDLILDDKAHIPAGSLDPIADKSITLMAASKTFNVAGLGASFAIVPDAKVRADFARAGAGIVPWPNVLGLVAAQAAFTQGGDWLDAQLTYLRKNRDYLVNAINKIDGLSALSPEATFLLWVDASKLGAKDTQTWCEQKGVGPSPGRDFGDAQFFRLNFGCSYTMLTNIVARLEK